MNDLEYRPPNFREVATPIPETGQTAGDFWSWAYSDTLNNRNRGIFAEYMVGFALDTLDAPRMEWDNWDVTYRDVGIEVKSAAFLQSWNQSRPSSIRFGIRATRDWDYEADRRGTEVSRSAKIYVFCLFTETDSLKADVFEISQWRFYVVSTTMVNQTFPNQQTLGLRPLERIAKPVLFRKLRSAVDKLLEQV